MNIAIYSTKGGVGKTSLAYSLSRDLNLRYVTNDITESALKSNSKIYSKKIPLHDNVFYDFGGFEDEDAYNIASSVDLVIVPTICEMNSLFKAIRTIKKIKNENILVIATMTDKEQDFEQVKMVIKKYFPKIKVLSFRRNKLLKNSMEKNKSAFEFMKETKNKQHLFKNAFSDYLNIIKEISNIKAQN